MRQFLILFLSLTALTFSLPAHAQNQGERRGQMMEKMKNMSPEQRRAMVEKFVASGKMPMLTKLWPTLSEDQKNSFISAGSQDERRAVMMDMMQTLDPQQRQEIMQAMQARKGSRGGGQGFGGGFGGADPQSRRSSAFGGNTGFPSMDDPSDMDAQ